MRSAQILDNCCVASDISSSATDWARFQPSAVAGLTLMQAHFTAHAFERHSHPTYAVGVTHSGVQTFHCRGVLHASQAGDVILFNPDEPHNGSAGTEIGFGYSMLYLEPEVLDGWLDASAGTAVSRYFRQSVVHDPAAAAVLRQALAASQPQESLRAETLLSEAMVRLLQSHGELRSTAAGCTDAGAERMARVRDYMQVHFAQNLGVEQLAELAGLSRVHFTRAFGRRFGVPPHIYLNALRLRNAQQALLSGQPLAQLALDCGFADQSHFNRRFKGSFGLSPKAWLAHMGQRRGSAVQ
jgi:AraC-like DNA-binding protein